MAFDLSKLTTSIEKYIFLGTLKKEMSATKFTWALSLWLVLFYNASFFKSLCKAIPLENIESAAFLISISLLLLLLNSLLLTIFVFPKIAKPITVIVLISASIAAYFMSAYGIVIHHTMIQNTIETDIKEVRALLNSTLATYIIFLGVIPSVLVIKIRLQFGTLKQQIYSKLKLWGFSLIAITILVAPFSADYASFFRNNKNIREMASPANFIYATISYFFATNKSSVVAPIGEDAKLNAQAAKHTKPILFVVVVGETARADHFSINGYHKPTTPLIAQQDIINYHKVFSCGTETAVSVPCMFSNLTRKHYSDKKGKSQESLLDVLKHSGYSVLWRDNNSSCKGTCNRVEYEDLTNLKIPELCNNRECFDNILLHDIDKKIDHMAGNKVIVLHQKGSHGPDYYNRYPENMEIFKPVCKFNKLQDCSNEEINNAFDNTIRMTDQFLNDTIEWLKTQSNTYNTGLIYLSDHGESLGEKGLYLHGMPYLIAPIEQKHIPFFFWFSTNFELESGINRECLRTQVNTEHSHDNLFHTVLSLLNVSTSLYKPELDMIIDCRK
ncbi:MAG: phosphoethanolamine--lipid A transferase [Gammaproteobacteria bacterium]|nr:MAG: phosphoethanolamine--lipid A transferase [Gammaproteobacteria bacterium]